eukprot:TRINITY_DN21743_c0_g1_i1.p3 TRINITY_DN21743_c0_g1~~TRINITY_DN21743_c0_g1_i1.p3  ORF type:complete len:122 (-),score=41.42 TRINITY_DN21743_c0_g1_i1:320-685(-)
MQQYYCLHLIFYKLLFIYFFFFFFLMIRRPPRSTHCISSAASDVYKRQQSTWAPWAIILLVITILFYLSCLGYCIHLCLIEKKQPYKPVPTSSEKNNQTTTQQNPQLQEPVIAQTNNTANQ